ncbi:MAG: PLD nuclease N-terminal domain-containing protein [candidate division WOR-3 bacterium]|nr:PLD nuclease N-terminal domain-containing protein [candidate division WOR-3 bacterium]
MHSLPVMLAAGTMGWLWLMICVFGGLIGIAGAVLWIWMLVEVLTRETDEGNNRLTWALVIVFTHWIGALIYVLARRPERIKRLGK